MGKLSHKVLDALLDGDSTVSKELRQNLTQGNWFMSLCCSPIYCWLQILRLNPNNLLFFTLWDNKDQWVVSLGVSWAVIISWQVGLKSNENVQEWVSKMALHLLDKDGWGLHTKHLNVGSLGSLPVQWFQHSRLLAQHLASPCVSNSRDQEEGSKFLFV